MLNILNNFLEATTIHGLAYISTSQGRGTRIIWTAVVLGAACVASFFLYETVIGFEVNYTSTTIETSRIQKYPFPAVTFDPGNFNSMEAFKRTLLNEFEFTRYKESDPLRNNEEFRNTYQWLVSPMNNNLFDDIEIYLMNEKSEDRDGKKTFLQSKGGIFRNEVCGLVSLYNDKILFKKQIRDIFVSNMYKFNKFNDLKDFIKSQVGPLIQEATVYQNKTKSEISSECSDKKNKETKKKMEAMLLSYMYIFLDTKSSFLGAGDLASGPYINGLTKGYNKKVSNTYYVSINTLLTDIFNNMVNGSLPVSIFEFPSYFVLPDKHFVWKNSNEVIVFINKMLEFINIDYEASRNYHYLWNAFNGKQMNITIFCYHYKSDFNCSEEPKMFHMAITKQNYQHSNIIRKYPERGMLLEGSIVSPPCANKETVRKFKIEKICSIISNISNNVRPFLKLMKFTKQSPIFLEGENEYASIFSNTTSYPKGFISKKMKVNSTIL